MDEIEFDFSTGTAALVEWDRLEEVAYEGSYVQAHALGCEVVQFLNEGGTQRGFVRGMGFDDKKASGVVTKVRRAVTVALTPASMVKRYERAHGAGDRSVSGLVAFIDDLNSDGPTPLKGDKLIASKAKRVEKILEGLTAAQRKAVLAIVAAG